MAIWSGKGLPAHVQILETILIPPPAASRTASATEVGNGDYACRVRGVIESEIHFELWLPRPSGWNGKFLAAGVGGEAGTLNYRGMSRALNRGYAASSTDTGHAFSDKTWAYRRKDRQLNFAARANHLLAMTSKALVKTYYGRPSTHSYFVGCSGGGREGLKEVQAFPEDFDGVLAGSAGPDQLAASLRLLWMQYVMEPTHRGLMADADWKLLADGTVAACDANDGVTDGVIDDPQQCRFDAATLLCSGEKTPQCLTQEQVEYAKRLFEPLRDGSGVPIDQGLAPGTLLRFSPRSSFAYTLYGIVVHDDLAWNPLLLDIRRDLAAARRRWPSLPNDQADLEQYRRRGGKLIYYHGWADPFLPALSIVAYRARVLKAMGAKRAEDVLKVFMVPGMGHCSGGTGPDQFGGSDTDSNDPNPGNDMLSALEDWVEHGRPPERIIATQYQNERPVRTRPLCAFPRHAVYTGVGSTDSADNFICR